MKSSIEVRDATVDDAPRISALLTVLAEEFIVGEFSTEGRLHLLTHFGVSAMEERLTAREYRVEAGRLTLLGAGGNESLMFEAAKR